jgi:hypothetical protein
LLPITFAVESWTAAIAEMRPLFHLLWDEVAIDKGKFGCDADDAVYEVLEQRGALIALTARCEGKLVGFFMGLIFPHMHYKNSGLICTTDAYFVLPEFRDRNAAGIRFFKFIEATLRARKVVKFYTSCKVDRDRSPMFEALGYRLQDFIFVKCL